MTKVNSGDGLWAERFSNVKMALQLPSMGNGIIFQGNPCDWGNKSRFRFTVD